MILFSRKTTLVLNHTDNLVVKSPDPPFFPVQKSLAPCHGILVLAASVGKAGKEDSRSWLFPALDRPFLGLTVYNTVINTP
jgi:hypothetical protein